MGERRDSIGKGDPGLESGADATALGMAFQITADPDGGRRFTFVGRRCLAVNGISHKAAMADASLLYDMILPEHREAFAAAEAKALAQRTPLDIEVAMRRPDGEVRWHRIASMPRETRDGLLVWDGLQIDITDRRRIAAELTEQRRRLAVAVEATGMGFWEWDLETGALNWSEHNLALYGLPPGTAVDIQRYLDRVHPDDREAVAARSAEARNRPGGGDFSMEHRIVKTTGENRWLLIHGRVSVDEAGKPKLVVGTTLDITDRKAADERRNLLMGELAHRAKNGIAVLMSMITQTARSAGSVEELEALLLARMQALATSQDLVTASGGRPVPLVEVMEKALAPFGTPRFEIDDALGEVTVRGEIAVALGLLLHEMATNAVKYGALSNAQGRVKLRRKTTPAGHAAFEWREADGPPVRPSNRQGFGTRLLQQVLRGQGGMVTFDFEPQGFRARVDCPTGG